MTSEDEAKFIADNDIFIDEDIYIDELIKSGDEDNFYKAFKLYYYHEDANVLSCYRHVYNEIMSLYDSSGFRGPSQTDFLVFFEWIISFYVDEIEIKLTDKVRLEFLTGANNELISLEASKKDEIKGFLDYLKKHEDSNAAESFDCHYAVKVLKNIDMSEKLKLHVSEDIPFDEWIELWS